jgi:hypothetical protein
MPLFVPWLSAVGGGSCFFSFSLLGVTGFGAGVVEALPVLSSS